MPVIHVLLQDLGAPRIALLLKLTDGVDDPILSTQAPQHLVIFLDGEHNVFEETGEAANEIRTLRLGDGGSSRLLRKLCQVLKLQAGTEGDDLLQICNVYLEALILEAKRRKGLDNTEDGRVVTLFDGSSQSLAGNGLDLALDVEELLALLVIAAVGTADESGVDLEEFIDGASSRFEIIVIEGAAGGLKAAGPIECGIDESEGAPDAGLGKVEVSGVSADTISECGGRAGGGEEEGRVGAGDVEEVGRPGAGESEEVAIEVRTLGKEGFEAGVEGALVSDALVEKASHGAHIGQRPHQSHCLRGPEVHRRRQGFRRDVRSGGSDGGGGGFVVVGGGHRKRRGDDRHSRKMGMDLALPGVFRLIFSLMSRLW